MPEEIVEVKEKKLFAAAFVPQYTGQNPIWHLNAASTDLDKMQVPTEYHDRVAYCRFFYEHDGIAYTTINKQVEIGINGYHLNPGTCNDNELLVYESLNRLILQFLKDAALEFLLSGLVIPEVTWDNVSGRDIDPKFRKSYRLPVDMWYRDPMSIRLRRTPLPNQVVVMVKVSDEDIFFIMNNGVFPDGTEDRETYRILVEQYPDYVREVKAGKLEFKLEDPLVLRRFSRSGTVWPTPYLQPALELFLHKRNLRCMDYAIAARTIGAIQLFRMGNDEFPLSEDDEDVVDNMRAQMRWRGMSGNTERVFQLFSNHTLEIDWITPDVKALLDEGKYRSVNEDILTALGLPRIIISGETLRSGSSNAEIAMIPPISSIKSMRGQLLEVPRKIYEQIREVNGFKGIPEPYYSPIVLQSPKDLAEMGQMYYQNGVISKTGWAQIGNFNFDTELLRMVMERDAMEELGIEERPDVPYSPQPNGGTPSKSE